MAEQELWQDILPRQSLLCLWPRCTSLHDWRWAVHGRWHDGRSIRHGRRHDGWSLRYGRWYDGRTLRNGWTGRHGHDGSSSWRWLWRWIRRWWLWAWWWLWRWPWTRPSRRWRLVKVLNYIWKVCYIRAMQFKSRMRTCQSLLLLVQSRT